MAAASLAEGKIRAGISPRISSRGNTYRRVDGSCSSVKRLNLGWQASRD